MGKFIVNGGVPLFGRVRVSGSKNAALPIIFASLITHGVSVVDNLPDIGDVRVALRIISSFGARITHLGSRAVIDTRDLAYARPNAELLTYLRASTYLMGATAVRFGRGEISDVGGCNFSARPIDMHLDAIRAFGGRVDGCHISFADTHPTEIHFKKRSVGATVNALLLASGIQGESRIYGAATEPHILNLIEYLRSAGAKISVMGDVITISGGELTGGNVVIGGDMIEAGTYLAASLISGGSVTVTGVDSAELSAFFGALGEGGAGWREDVRGVSLVGGLTKPVNITTEPYPGFATDLQPVTAPLLTRRGGKITETVWQGRFGYLKQLSGLGLAYRIIDNTAEVFPSELHSGSADAPDLRGGMALLLAALSAEGTSVIDSAEVILRGYEDPCRKLSALGAEIEYIKDQN